MLLLDEVLAHDEHGARASVTIRPGAPFAGPDGVPAHVGIEYMAQACGVWAGGEARRLGGPVRLGYLLGTRSYRATRPYLSLGERFEVTADLIFRDGGMGVFDCRILGAGNDVVAEAQLNVYQPDESKG
jgi:predicted hotdog family 3-hydroxylacyl-ACP dehydratase